MRFLLDTNICIYIAKTNPPAVRARFSRHATHELAMSVITLGELRFGAEKSQARERAFATLARLEATIPVASLDEEVACHYGQIRSELQKRGLPIGNNDLWIAAHARAKGWVLVTRNTREFERVENLQIENWADEDS